MTKMPEAVFGKVLTSNSFTFLSVLFAFESQNIYNLNPQSPKQHFNQKGGHR